MEPQSGLLAITAKSSVSIYHSKRLTQRHIKLVSSQLFYAHLGETDNRLIPINKGKDRIYIVERRERREEKFRYLKKWCGYSSFFLSFFLSFFFFF